MPEQRRQRRRGGRDDGFVATAGNSPGPVPGHDAATPAGDQAPAALASRPHRLCGSRARAQPAPRAAGSGARGRRTGTGPRAGRRATAETWLAEGLDPSRAALERDLDTSLDNVFPDETPVSVRQAGGDADVAPLSPSPLAGSGGRDFDDGGPNLEATLTSEASLPEHLEAQLDLATDDLRRAAHRPPSHRRHRRGRLSRRARGGDRRPPRRSGSRGRGASSPSSRPSIRRASRPAASPNAWRSSCGSATASTRPCGRSCRGSTSWRGAISRR